MSLGCRKAAAERMEAGVPGENGVEFDDDPARVDLDALWSFLSRDAYWGRWRTREVVERQLASAWRVVGAYADGRMVGFARAVSDGVGLAYLADVYVAPPSRRRGVGIGLVAAMIEEGPGAAFRWMLHTADAHGLYARFGFAPPDATYLERPGRPDDLAAYHRGPVNPGPGRSGPTDGH
jgi:GNAT superfamily N-acetyltransferase